MQDASTKLETDRIYVPLALVQRTKPEKRNKGEYSPEAGTHLYEPQYEKKQRFEHEAFLTQILERGEGKTKGKRIALIGEPGAGKTTLLQCIAFWVLEKNLGFPIWISLADLERSAKGDLQKYLLENWLSHAVPPTQLTQAKEELTAQIQQGRVWLLLDGVDEVAVSGMQTLKNLSRQFIGWISKLRVVLTCRLNVWQADRNDLEAFETYRILDFDYPKQVRQFIDKWFGNLTSDCSSEERESKAERLKAQLDEAERGRLRNLIQNPLRLMLLCSTWESKEGNLPQTKAGLYKQFVNKIYEWNNVKTKEQNELNNALGRLALKDIQKGSSRFRLLESFISKELGAPDDNKSPFYKALRFGWLNHVGIAAESPQEKVYAFYHATFEEYFAALCVKDWDFFLPRAHKNELVKDDTGKPQPYPIFEPQWKEVILLWLGEENVEKEQKEEFIEALIKFRDGCGGFYQHRAYFLAAAGVAEFGECSRADKVVAQIVRWSSRYGLLLDGARAALQQTHRAKAIDALVNLIATEDNYYTRMLALPSLGEIAVGNEGAIAALLDFSANSENDFRNCMQALESLGLIDPGNESAIETLVNLITTYEDKYIHQTAAESLGKIAVGNEGAIDALLDLIATSKDEYTLQRAVESLGKIAVGNESAIAAMVNLVATSQDESTLQIAAKSLGQIAVGNESAIAAMVNLVATSQDKSTLQIAAKSLGQIAVGNESAIEALVNLIASLQPEFIRWQAAYSLGQIAVGNESAIAALKKLIATSQSELTRWLAAYSLGQIDPDNEGAIAALEKLIAIFEDESTRWQAAESLGQIDPDNEGAIAALIKLIDTSEDESTRSLAAYSLGQIAVGNKSAIAALIKLIATSKDESTRRQAVKSLGKIAFGNESAIAALIKLITRLQPKFILKQEAYRLGARVVGPERAFDSFNFMAIFDNNITYMQAVESLKNILPADKMEKVIIALKYNFKPDKERDEGVWSCAQNVSYSTFYEAWHYRSDIKIAIRFALFRFALYSWRPALFFFLWLSISIFTSNLILYFIDLHNVNNPTNIQRQQQIR